jgi:hypothetical protein
VSPLKDSIINLILERIAQNYEEQIPYYEEMYRIAREQQALLQQAEVDTDLLLGLINQRQELIENLEGRNREISLIRDEVCQALGIKEFNITNIQNRVNGPGTHALTTVLAELSTVLTKIKELDKKNEEVLREEISKIKDKLRQTQNAKKVTKAYQPAAPLRDGVFIDYNK